MLRSRWQRLPFSRSGGKGPGDGGCSRKTYLRLLRRIDTQEFPIFCIQLSKFNQHFLKT